MKTKVLAVLALLVGLASLAAAQERGKKDGEIDWLVTWKQALEEGKRTGKPILLAFGKPACEGVPGLW